MVLGCLCVFQLRTEWQIEASLPTRKVNELAKIYGNQQKQLEKYKREKEYLQKQIKNYNHDREIIRLRMAAGLLPLKGKGITIILGSSPANGDHHPSRHTSMDYFDLKLLINELWVADAEAIGINNYRIVNTSGFSCAGTTLLVDTRRIAPPYVISVIGDPETLRNVLMRPGGIVEQEIIANNLEFTIETSDGITIPAYKPVHSYEFALPVKEQ